LTVGGDLVMAQAVVLGSLRELADRGWETRSHTRSQPRLTALGDRPLQGELRGSRADCEENLGRPCRPLAFRYSDFDAGVVRAAGVSSATPSGGWRFASGDARSISGSPLARGIDAALRSARRGFPR
jgi:hypothetical protein